MCKTSCCIFTKGNYLTQRQFVTGRVNWIVSLVGFARLYLKHPNQEGTANLSKLKNVQVQRRSSSEVLPNKSHARGMADLLIKGFDLQVLFTTHIIHVHFPTSGQGGSVVVRTSQHVCQINVLLSRTTFHLGSVRHIKQKFTRFAVFVLAENRNEKL